MNAKLHTYSAKKFNNLLSSISRLLYYILHATAAINYFLCNTFFFIWSHFLPIYIFNPCPRSIPSGPSSIPCASAGVHQQWHQRLLALGLSLRSICSQVHLYQRVPSLPNTSRTHQEAMHWRAADTFQYVSVQVDCAFSTAAIAWDLSSHIHGVRALGHLHLGVILVTVLLKWSHWVSNAKRKLEIPLLVRLEIYPQHLSLLQARLTVGFLLLLFFPPFLHLADFQPPSRARVASLCWNIVRYQSIR